MTRFERPLRIELGASRRLVIAAVVVHAPAAAACLVAALPLPLRLLGAALVGLHCRYFLRRQAGGGPRLALAGLAWDTTRGWRVRAGGSGWQPARLRYPVFVSASLAMVRFRLDNGCACSALVVAGRLPADDFRRLRVRLLQSAGDDGRT